MSSSSSIHKTILKTALAALPLLQASSAHGQDDRMQFFWQPNSGMSAAVLQYSSTWSNTETDTSAGVKVRNTESNTTVLTPTFSFGLNENWTFSAQVASYGLQSTEIEPVGSAKYPETTVGMDDPLIGLRNCTRFGNWRLYFGANASVAIDHLINTTQTQNGNRSTGGPTLTPFLGTSYSSDLQNFFGLKIAYQYVGERIETNAGTGLVAGADTIIDGGGQLSVNAVYEFHLADFYAYSSLNYSFNESQTATTNLTQSSTPGYSTYGITLVTGYLPTANWTLLLSFGETQTPTRNSTSNVILAHLSNSSSGAVRYEF